MKKCQGYYVICQEKPIKGLIFWLTEGKKEHAFCMRCMAFAVKMKYLKREQVLEQAPFLKNLIEMGDNLTKDEFIEKLRNMPEPSTEKKDIKREK